MNLTEHLRAHAEARPGQAALVDRLNGSDRVASFGDLESLSNQVAVSLKDRGFEPGETVLVFHPVAIELYGFLLGCFQAGVVAVLADPSGGVEFMTEVCRRIRPKGFFGSRKAHLLRWKMAALREIPHAMHPRGWWPGSKAIWSGTGGDDQRYDGGAGHPALITFTSGSTGVPKGVVRSHGFLLDQHRALEAALELRPGESDLTTLPVFALANMASAVTSILADGDLGKPGEVDPERILRQCERWKVTRSTAAPAFFEALMRGREFPSLEKVFTGGAPVFPDLVERLSEACPGMEVTAVYGSTEAEPVAEISRQEWNPARRAVVRDGGGLPAGRPVCEVAILKDQFGTPVSGEAFADLVLEAGQRGEIVVAGPQVLSGYLGGEGDEETKIRVGEKVWHRTGDAGWIDGEGELWLLGRCAARIRLRGETGYPLAIEAALRMEFRGRRMAALDDQGDPLVVIEGEIPEGFERQAAELGVERVVAIDRLPMDRRHQSKIDYPRLRDALGAKFLQS